ncbi:hypothetical protein TNCV_4012741 [Trichonephila clavipes]|nr:hypothetical protein TNCV_4012741 [Trichonephila clavipes]
MPVVNLRSRNGRFTTHLTKQFQSHNWCFTNVLTELKVNAAQEESSFLYCGAKLTSFRKKQLYVWFGHMTLNKLTWLDREVRRIHFKWFSLRHLRSPSAIATFPEFLDRTTYIHSGCLVLMY